MLPATGTFAAPGTAITWKYAAGDESIKGCMEAVEQAGGKGAVPAS